MVSPPVRLSVHVSVVEGLTYPLTDDGTKRVVCPQFGVDLAKREIEHGNSCWTRNTNNKNNNSISSATSAEFVLATVVVQEWKVSTLFPQIHSGWMVEQWPERKLLGFNFPILTEEEETLFSNPKPSSFKSTQRMSWWLFQRAKDKETLERMDHQGQRRKTLFFFHFSLSLISIHSNSSKLLPDSTTKRTKIHQRKRCRWKKQDSKRRVSSCVSRSVGKLSGGHSGILSPRNGRRSVKSCQEETECEKTGWKKKKKKESPQWLAHQLFTPPGQWYHYETY